MRHVVHVIDRRRDVESIGIAHVASEKIPVNKRGKLGRQWDGRWSDRVAQAE